LSTSDFDYELPSDYIAQIPLEPRDSARLLILDRKTESIQHTIFRDLGEVLIPGDLLVLNQTRVIPARLFARKVRTGGRVELLLLHRIQDNTWEVLVGGKGLGAGKRIQVESGPGAEVISEKEGGRRWILFDRPIEDYLIQAGHVPLPPYIHVPLENPERYQTIYAENPGSVAAPTAGLHFTYELMEHLRQRGIKFVSVILHIGLDTFAPVTEEFPEEHPIHTEWCHLSKDAACEINQAHANGNRVIAVGTTSVRALESAALVAKPGQSVAPIKGSTCLYILPGYKFKVVDALITNFHLPRSTLIMLVSAFAGRELILNTYELAKKEDYRFYSFGDAMLIL
jgi:S-adenosylmethionine:tRNA ribosyltransferase-isomerase